MAFSLKRLIMAKSLRKIITQVRSCSARDVEEYMSMNEDNDDEDQTETDTNLKMKQLLEEFGEQRICTPPDDFSQSLDENDRTRLNEVARDVEVLSYLSSYVPQKMSSYDWNTLLTLTKLSDRIKTLEFICKLEKKNTKTYKKVDDLRGPMDFLDTNVVIRQCHFGGIFERFERRRLKRMFMVDRQLKARRLNLTPTLVLDFSFLNRLSPISQNLTGCQTANTLGAVSKHRLPWMLSLVNFPTTDPIYRRFYERYLRKSLVDGNVYMPAMSTLTEQSYLDLYDRDRLIYLCPDARKEMTELDQNAVYIMGAIVDKGTQSSDTRNMTLGVARQHGISMRRLPLDWWKSGTKSLSLNNVVKILMDAYENDGDWQLAVRNTVSKRHFISPEINKNSYIRRKYRETGAYSTYIQSLVHTVRNFEQQQAKQ